MDIAIGILLALHNKKIVLARGRRPAGFIALTLVLWFGLEIIGCTVALLAFGYVADGVNNTELLTIAAVGYGAAAIGALIAYLVAKSCKPGDYYPATPMPYAGVPYPGMPYPPAPYGVVPPAVPNPDPLEIPAAIEIIRDYSMRGDITSWKFILNTETVGNLGNGASRSTQTRQRQNTLRAISEDGRESAPLMFNIESGGSAQIYFKGDRFEPSECKGILPPVPPVPPAAPYNMPYVPPAPYAPQLAPNIPSSEPPVPPPAAQGVEATRACSECGAQIKRTAQYCNRCGAKQEGKDL